MSTPSVTHSLIRGVDRILIHAQDVERVFSRFRYEFGLPVAWPLTNRDLLVSGGLYAGNMTIEIGRFSGFTLPGTRFYGLGLASWLPTWETVNGLTSRGMVHTPPLTLPYEEPIAIRSTLTFLSNLLDGQLKTAFWLGRRLGGNSRMSRALAALSTWTIGTEAGAKTFSMLLGSSMLFICNNQIDRHQEGLAELRGNWQRTQQNRPHGIIRIAAVDIEVSTKIAGWRRLLDRPDLNSDSIQAFSMGPPLRFHPGVGNRLLGIEFLCAGLDPTAQNLIEKRSLLLTEGKRFLLPPGQMDGLAIGFSQSPPTMSEEL
jgi:hypothetical protein